MNHKTIEAFTEAFANFPRLAEMEVRSETHGTLRLRRSLQSADKKSRPAVVQTAPLPTRTVGEIELLSPILSKGTVVTSTLVGVFRMSTKTTIDLGSAVTEGQTLGIIDVMRLANEVVAPVTGEITAIFVQDSQPVEYGQALFEIGGDTPSQE